MKKEKLFYYVGLPVVVLLAILSVFFISSFVVENQAISRDETIQSAKAGISKEERRRVDLFVNMVDAVQAYDKHEKETLATVVEARSKAKSGDVIGAKQALDVVVEAYPDIKAQPNYSQAMKEFSITENRLAEYRDNYNKSIKDYKKYVKSFPNKQFLSVRGYEVIDYKYLDFEVDNSKATNLFD